ncbi:HPF/RaiA family ribosome-associated protein [Sorangium sp. So ce233]|uniref:HPF/RaiA family ribosome-associated protein n=1 Tax=Sorangium sp. So ce233 TaxID=3133290 RepID=UPI003F612F1D
MSKIQEQSRRAAFPSEVARPVKRVSGRTPAERTPLAVRTTGVEISPDVREYVRERLGHRLSKFATQIERVSVRLLDVNGPRGGVDTACRIKVVLSGLESAIAQEVAAGIREAVDRASHVVERAVSRAIRRSRPAAAPRDGARRVAPPATRGSRLARGEKAGGRRSKRRPLPMPEGGSLIGRRVGRGADNLARAAARPDKQRRDATVDTAQPGWSVTDRRAGGSSTAARNTKLNTAGASAALEDSADGRPSRKSTRRSANRQKQDDNLRRRQTRAASAPKTRAAKAAARP